MKLFFKDLVKPAENRGFDLDKQNKFGYRYCLYDLSIKDSRRYYLAKRFETLSEVSDYLAEYSYRRTDI